MSSPLANCRLFLSEFRRTFRTTGAVLPSGRALARSLAAPVRESSGPLRVLEVGPGTGEVTLRIAEAMNDGDTLDLVELNDRFVERLRERLVQDAELAAVSERVQIHHAAIEEVQFDGDFDVVVSGLPLNNFASADVERILDKLLTLLKPGGVLTFFEYIAVRRAKGLVSSSSDRRRLAEIGEVLEGVFSGRNCRHDAIWTNIPPAWSHRVQRSAEPNAANS